MKKVSVLVLALVMVFLSSCSNKFVVTEPPEITISSSGAKADYQVTKTDWSGTKDSLDYIFRYAVKDDYVPIYVKPGENIFISFDDSRVPYPDTCTLKDVVLTQLGFNKYESEPSENKIYESNGGYICTLEDNPSEYYSTNSDDYEAGNLLRGYELTCTWDGKTCVYTFIIKSDITQQ